MLFWVGLVLFLFGVVLVWCCVGLGVVLTWCYVGLVLFWFGQCCAGFGVVLICVMLVWYCFGLVLC